MPPENGPKVWPPPVPQPPEQESREPELLPGWRGWRQRLLYVPEGSRSAWDVVVWWEKRRIPVNLLIGGVGFVSLVLFFLFMSAPGMLRPGEDAVEPMALLLAPFAFNFFYTAGWVVELFLRLVWTDGRRAIGPALLGMGVLFSLTVVCLPSLITFVALIGRLL